MVLQISIIVRVNHHPGLEVFKETRQGISVSHRISQMAEDDSISDSVTEGRTTTRLAEEDLKGMKNGVWEQTTRMLLQRRKNLSELHMSDRQRKCTPKLMNRQSVETSLQACDLQRVCLCHPGGIGDNSEVCRQHNLYYFVIWKDKDAS